MATTKQNKTGWHKESLRHSQARKLGKSIPKKINLKKYSGTWQQTKVTNEPYFQKNCEIVTATYTPIKKGKIKVTNRCYDKNKKLKNKITGTARTISEDNKKLKVSFFPFIEGDYKINRLNSNYTRAEVKSGKTTWQLKKIK